MNELKQIKRHHERQLKNMDKKLTMYQIHPDDVSWLIKQAERVQELEQGIENLNELTDMQHEQILIFHRQLNQLIRTNQRYKQALEELKELRAMYSVVNGERIRYKQALEFYADEEHYKDKQISKPLCDADGVYISNDVYDPPIIYLDKGETARKALEGKE